MRVFVLSHKQQPLMPCRPARARKLLHDGKAAAFRHYPFTIILKERVHGDTQPISLNVDPGSRTTGLVLVALFKSGPTCITGINLNHRGHKIKEALDGRRSTRRTRRNRKTRHRKARFDNRKRQEGWLPPSLMSRVHNVEAWAKRISILAPIRAANIETVRFDTQLLQNPDIEGSQYQQGTLFGYEVREYLLQRHRHTCAYCTNLTKDLILEKEHILPHSLGGTDRISNLVLACRTCNQDKGNLHPSVWMQQCASRVDKLNQARSAHMARILKGIRPTLKDAAAVNATRYAIGRVIKALVPDTQFWTGGRTKFNRTRQGYCKDHWIDAACVGETGGHVHLENSNILTVTAKGHGSRQMCRMDKYGFPRTGAKSGRLVYGFKTGDMVKAIVPAGKKQGIHVGRVAVRSSGYFNIAANATIQGISYRHCTVLHKADGFHYQQTKIAHKQSGGVEKQAA